MKKIQQKWIIIILIIKIYQLKEKLFQNKNELTSANQNVDYYYLKYMSVVIVCSEKQD